MGMTGGGGRAVPFINVTPLIDVLLVVIIIFLVITPLKPSRFKADIPSQRDPNEDVRPPFRPTLSLFRMKLVVTAWLYCGVSKLKFSPRRCV